MEALNCRKGACSHSFERSIKGYTSWPMFYPNSVERSREDEGAVLNVW
jgi:hypothetical protein